MWSVVSPAFGDKLSAAMVRQMGDNLFALAEGQPGAPPLAVNSLVVSGVASLNGLVAGVASMGTVAASEGLFSTASAGQLWAQGLGVAGVASHNTIHAGGGVVAGVFSAATVQAGGLSVAGISSLGTLAAAGFSALGVSSLETLHLSGAAPATPAANRLYKDNTLKGWVNFNGTGTVAIRDSFNVSSITDLGTGSYRINLATSMAAANYAAMGVASTGGNGMAFTVNSMLAASATIGTWNPATGIPQDSDLITCAIIGKQ